MTRRLASIAGLACAGLGAALLLPPCPATRAAELGAVDRPDGHLSFGARHEPLGPHVLHGWGRFSGA